MLLEGEQLGRYRLLRQLGSGGMGDVYLAEDARIAQQVAIKVIRNEGLIYPSSEDASEAARLFEREAKAIARLDHPNILPLYAYGEETLRGTLLTYLVMPYRKEGTLVDWLRQRGSSKLLTPAEVVPLVQQAAAALQHAHHQQIIHQDIKPPNFLIRRREDQPACPDLLLADFGIARLSNASASASQSVRGTPTYMAPEQWDGAPVPATDQYALAIMAYELLVGRPPFQGNMGQVMRQHCQVPPLPPGKVNPSLSSAIDAVFLRALAKQPGERYPSVTAFAQALNQAVHREGELTATLAISQAEAHTGTTRQLTLPGGRQVNVTVPSGVSDGATIRLEGQGMPSSTGGLPGPLVLRIAIHAGEPRAPLQQESAAATSLGSRLSSTSKQEYAPPPPQAPSTLQKPEIPASLPPERVRAALAQAANSTAGPVINVYLLPTPGNFPRGITRGPDGNLWFTEPVSNKIGRIMPTGSIIEYPLPTSESHPFGITSGPDGALWFTEGFSDKIGCITPTGSITEYPLPTTHNYPYGITRGPDGNLWFTESARNKIGRITLTGSITEYPLPTTRSFPRAITRGPDGNLWFTEEDGNKIGRITLTGSITEYPLPKSRSRPLGITSGPDGNLWFTEFKGNKIGRITPTGSITEYFLPTSKSHPFGITSGPDGNLWFTEFKGNKVGCITPTGSIQEYPLPTSGGEPSEITSGPDGALWFTEYAGNKIGRITLSGR